MLLDSHSDCLLCLPLHLIPLTLSAGTDLHFTTTPWQLWAFSSIFAQLKYNFLSNLRSPICHTNTVHSFFLFKYPLFVLLASLYAQEIPILDHIWWFLSPALEKNPEPQTFMLITSNQNSSISGTSSLHLTPLLILYVSSV